ncbi:hypothetical protein GLW08_00675 [Pontibacillus yanchengensis]|uniref:Uncharacterized protein n=2 Tax=Pontibacillus yanchengensis TaxID=462910 RepID=A0ACC7VAY3_9BACI|nr:hypothetical protein [Pontibacillus yanchengensis]MYL51843.1 hypothetical protein [Pontibacillus yanchengensis]
MKQLMNKRCRYGENCHFASLL